MVRTFTLALIASLTLSPGATAVGEYVDRAIEDACRRYTCTEAPQAARRAIEAEPAPPSAPVTGVEVWRPLVARYWPAGDVATALRIIRCESHGDPNARNRHSGAAGLFQHIPRYWPERAAKAGWAGASIYDPAANIAVSAWLWNGGAGASHWRASARCW